MDKMTPKHLKYILQISEKHLRNIWEKSWQGCRKWYWDAKYILQPCILPSSFPSFTLVPILSVDSNIVVAQYIVNVVSWNRVIPGTRCGCGCCGGCGGSILIAVMWRSSFYTATMVVVLDEQILIKNCRFFLF